MKVLMIDHFSATSMYSTDLCNELGKNVEVELLTVNGSSLEGKQTYQYEKILFGHYNGNKIHAGILYLISLVRSFWKIAFGNYDVIHIQSFRNIEIESILYRITRRKNVKYIHTLHNILPHEAKAKDKENYGRIYRLCDALIAHNQASRAAFISVYPEYESKVRIVPHGAYSYIRDLVHPMKQTDKTVFYVLGLIRKYKGIDILLEAVTKLSHEDQEKCHVIIAGRQDKRVDATDYEGYIRKNNLEDLVTFIPRKVTDEEMAQYYNSSDVCVFPYRNIYGSGALMMAYVFEKPVLVSDIPTFIEETENGHTGLSFRNGDSDDLAEKMHRFIEMSESERESYRSKIVQLRDTKYSWKSCAKKTLEIYND